MLVLISFFFRSERLLENFNRFLLIILSDLIIGPIFLKIKEKNIRLNVKPINFEIKKNKYIKKASKKYLVILIINNLKFD